MTEREAMECCLELARKGWGRVSPSPLVGAVLLKDEEIVGEGHYAEFGGSHSEVVALEMAGAEARGRPYGCRRLTVLGFPYLIALTMARDPRFQARRGSRTLPESSI